MQDHELPTLRRLLEAAGQRRVLPAGKQDDAEISLATARSAASEKVGPASEEPEGAVPSAPFFSQRNWKGPQQ